MTKAVEDDLIRCLKKAEALENVMNRSLRDAGTNDIGKYGSFRAFARAFNGIVEEAASIVGFAPTVAGFELDKLPGPTNSRPSQQREYFETTRARVALLKADLSHQLPASISRPSSIVDFFRANLRRAVIRTPERERDVQDVVEQLLIGRGYEKGIDYDREVGRVKVSSKEVIPDLIMAPFDLAIEIKLLKNQKQLSSIVDEINADIVAYHLNYKFRLFIVYDLGVIRDEVEFCRDLEGTDGVRVIVVKH
ncbi:MAG: hypothetical protein OXH28_06655 [bacterium]|nr:hypothetical protein [bacterium]